VTRPSLREHAAVQRERYVQAILVEQHQLKHQIPSTHPRSRDADAHLERVPLCADRPLGPRVWPIGGKARSGVNARIAPARTEIPGGDSRTTRRSPGGMEVCARARCAGRRPERRKRLRTAVQDPASGAWRLPEGRTVETVAGRYSECLDLSIGLRLTHREVRRGRRPR
jgi:hypothetical protein